MFTNYFKTFLRNLTRHTAFSLINIIGLTTGLAACLLIAVFVWDENQYDRNIADGDRIFRIYSDYTNTSGNRNMASVPPAFASTLKREFPESEQTLKVFVIPPSKALFESGNQQLYEESGYLVDSTFTEIFPLNFVHGSSKEALNSPTSIILSEELAAKFFGTVNPVGKEIQMNKHPFKISGIFRKDPKFHLQFNYLVPLSTAGLPADRMESWVWHQFMVYAKLKKGTDVKKLESKFQKTVTEKTKEITKEAGLSDRPVFQALKDIHLYSADFKFDIANRGNITYVKALSVIAAFILLIACFNFVNLATSRSLQRAREVGVRKTIGAGRTQLMTQFIGETLITAFCCMLLSIIIVILTLPWLNEFTGKQISFGIFIEPQTILLLLGLLLVAGLLAGFYPAMMLSGFRPVQVLKAAVATDSSGKMTWIRHGLVVVQFTLSVLLIISAMVVSRQVNYLHNMDLGFRKEQIMFFPMRGDKMFNNTQVFKNEMLKSPDIESVSIGYGYPGDAVAGDEIILNKKGEQTTMSTTHLLGDFDYIKTLQAEIIAGRDFSESMGTDKDHAWIINETAVKEFGFETPAKALGQTLSWHTWRNPDSLKTGTVIGVVKDFNYKSLYDKVEPAVIHIYPDAAWKVAVKIKPGAESKALAHIQNAWHQYSPEFPLEYSFLDGNFEKMYVAEDKLQTLVWIFTSIAIFVGCLGLFGLAAFAASRRRKELGIRKVLGASTEGLVMLLAKDFMRLVLLALVIAAPVAWILMNKWLADFAYRINISWWIFALAGFLALLIAFISVSFQAIKAALMNPVKSLRTE